MPITKATGFLDTTGVMHATAEQAQVAELRRLLDLTDGSAGVEPKSLDMMATDLVRNGRDDLLAILTTGPKSRPGARKKAGTTNPKRATKAQATTGFKAMHAAVEGATPTETAA